MANVKFTPQQWERAREYFEAGLSLSKISEKTGIDKGAVSRKANSDGWIKGAKISNVRDSSSSIKPPSIIYLITSDQYREKGIYKIGITNDIEFRLRTMQTGCPYRLYAFRTFAHDRPASVEAALHAFFNNKRVNGEWFVLSEQDIGYIDSANFEGLSNGS